MACKHTTTARSARDERVWVCLKCGQHLSTLQQVPLMVFDNKPAGEIVVETFPDNLPEPPERGVP